MQFADERQRDRLHRHAEVHGDHRRRELPGELDDRRQIEAVVERAHERDQRGREQHAVPQLLRFAIARRQPDQRGDEHAGEDRQAAEQRRRALGQTPLARLVDRTDGSRESAS